MSEADNPPYEAELSNSDIQRHVRDLLEMSYAEADNARKSGYVREFDILGHDLASTILKLGTTRHAARGVAVTLLAYKVIRPEQDIRRHKAELTGGFSARAIDSKVTVPFLQSYSLPYNVETHWLSQTFSFAGPYVREEVLKTTPKAAGPLLIDVVNSIEEAKDPPLAAKAALVLLMGEMIEERNKGRVALEKPKDLPIDEVLELLARHFRGSYEKNSPRLPQLAIYAIYDVLTKTVDRYKDMQLQPLERMKAANRKSGSVGDVDINGAKGPLEAVEVKFDVQISKEIVAEAIQKIRTESVERYFILSTAGIKAGDEDDIRKMQRDFRRSNGCEIIVNGVLDSIGYYLRLIRSTADFVVAYTELVEEDPDLGYEHRIAWNMVCSTR